MKESALVKNIKNIERFDGQTTPIFKNIVAFGSGGNHRQWHLLALFNLFF